MWKYLKRENFWGIFEKRFVITALLAAVLYCGTLNLWYDAEQKRLSRTAAERFYGTLQKLDERLAEERMEDTYEEFRRSGAYVSGVSV